jgi:import receptor subunit TOM22
MVKVTVVEERDPAAASTHSSPYSSPTSSAASSELSLVSEPDAADETLLARLAALVDIVPPTTRQKLAARAETAASVVKRGGRLVGNLVWIVTTSALLVGLPLALSLEDEAKIVAQEKELAAQQQGAQQASATSDIAR